DTFVREYKPKRRYEDRESVHKSERKEFKREFRHDERKEHRHDKRRDDRREFKRDDRREFKRDDRREFKRDDRREFKRERNNRKSEFDYKPSGHGPKLGADRTTYSSSESRSSMRPRKRREV
ncbi:MAG: hypothetical protein K2H86_02585, partial [Muribaculaceae bacterium]|nr:hypothetical protein [Muribaculaceae bacterium]